MARSVAVQAQLPTIIPCAPVEREEPFEATSSANAGLTRCKERKALASRKAAPFLF